MKLITYGPNVHEVVVDAGNSVLFSYETPVAAIVQGRAYVTEKKWSVTTSRHISQFMAYRMSTKKPQHWFDNLLGVNPDVLDYHESRDLQAYAAELLQPRTEVK